MKTSSTLASSFATVLAVAALGATSAASAATSSPSDHRGYQTCVKALDTESLSGVVFPRVYYIAHQAEAKTYYLNATAWQNGERVVKRITCETSANGRQVTSFATNDGRFALADGKRLEVAKR